MAKNINVLVVDDSAFMRKVITDILVSAGDIEVVGTARDGAEALSKVKTLQPDVITLDVEMPVMDGLNCLKELQKITDAPVIMLSSLTRDGARATIEALEAGAIDFVTKPTGLFDISGEEKKKELITKVKIARSIRKGKTGIRPAPVRRVEREPAKPVAVVQKRPPGSDVKSSTLKSIVAIGTSTGGPKALQEVIPLIPGDIPAAVLIVQHMPAGFTKSLAERLNVISELAVKEAEQDDRIQPGVVYVAPGDYHMEVARQENGEMRILLNKNPQVGGHRPSVNVMMNSLAATGFKQTIGVIMTGMGADGSEGIKNLKQKNDGYILSQDEKSCVVYGMPRAAVQTGVVDKVVPLKEIADEIAKYLGVFK